MTRTIGSLFAGIGGFDLGFERAGFRTAFVCEIDKSAQTVLRHRFPAALLFKDVRSIGAHDLPKIDVLTFGSPCQDLSVAGKRAGLAGERSGLFHEATRIIRELRERDGTPDLVVWENVPGAFSSNDGRDFEAVVQAMVDLGARDVAWRILDSQFFGVAQRRRRVFLVADFRAERAGSILFEPEGVRGNPPARRASRKGASGGAPDGARGNSGESGPWPADVTATLDAQFGQKYGCDNQHLRQGGCFFVPLWSSSDQANAERLVEKAGTLSCDRGTPGGWIASVAVPVEPIVFHPTQDPISSQNGISHVMSNGSKGGSATVAVEVAFEPRYYTRDNKTGGAPTQTPPLSASAWKAGDAAPTVAICATGEVTHTLTAAAAGGATEDGTGRKNPIIAQAMAVRRLTPTECGVSKDSPTDGRRKGSTTPAASSNRPTGLAISSSETP